MTRATATKKATRTSTRVTKTIAKAATTKKTPKTATKTPSFMLSVALGGKGKKGNAKVVRKEKPLWDTKQLAPEQWLS